MKIFTQKRIKKTTVPKTNKSYSTIIKSYSSDFVETKHISLFKNKYENRTKTTFLNKNHFQLFAFCILMISIIQESSDNDSFRNLLTTSKITIKIAEKGRQEILSTNYTGGYPTRTYINGVSTTPSGGRIVNLNAKNSIVRMEWDYNLANISYMFYQLTNITEVDLSEVNCAQIWNMSNMFSGCSNITSINLNNFKTDKVVNMVSLFSQCYSLISIDVTRFDTRKVEYMHYMFKGCHLFTSINVSNFDTSKVLDMSSMFADCRTLTSLDISNFDTSLVVTTGHMFNGCINLISLNLSNFNTWELKYWDNMFKNCHNLAYINLINGKENIISNMANILLNTMDNMVFCVDQPKIPKFKAEIDKKNCKVYDCEHDWRSVQKKIDPVTKQCIDSCQETSNYKYEYFSQCVEKCPNGTIPNENNICEIFVEPEKIIVTTNIEEMITTIIEKPIVTTVIEKPIVTTIIEKPIVTTIIEKSIVTTIIEKPIITTIIEKQIETTIIEKPIETTIIEKPIVTTILEKPIITTFIEEKIVTTNNEKQIETTNTEKLIETTNVENIVQSTNNEKIVESTIISGETEKISDSSPTSEPGTEKESYDTSETDSKSQENNIISTDTKNDQTNSDIPTNENIETEKQTNTKSQISSSTNQRTYIEADKTIIPTNILSQTHVGSKCNYDSYVNNLCTVYDNNIVIMGDHFIKEILQSYPIIEGKNLLTTNGNVTFQITTGDNEKKCLEGDCGDNKGMSIIDLKECETLLRNKYNIHNNNSLIYFKMEIVSNITYEKNIQYDVYEPINKTKLDLSICENVSIDIYVPVELSEKTRRLYKSLKEAGYDLFNINDPFYLKLCTPYKTENGTDVLLEDRKNNYYYNSINETTCQSNCQFSKYDSGSKYVKCECSINNETMNMTDYKKFVPKKFYNSFYDILKYSNYKVLWCYNLAFHIDSVTINIGSIIVIAFFILYLITFVIYLKNGIDPVKVDMMRRIFDKPLKDKTNNNNENNLTFSGKIKKNSTIHQRSTEKTATKITSDKNHKHRKRKSKHKHKDNPPTKRKSHTLSKSQRNDSTQFNNAKIKGLSNRNSNTIRTLITDKVNDIKNNKGRNSKYTYKQKKKSLLNSLTTGEFEEKQLLNYDNFELNNMEYEEALQKDKRSMIRSYWSVINREHLILLTFFSQNDFNLSHVKFARFIFIICTEMTLNVYLFSDETMHKIYLSYGEYDIMQHIAQIIMTTVFSQIMEVFICFLSLTDLSIYKIKDLKRNKKQNQETLIEIFDILKAANRKIKKNIFYFSFLVLLFYWYSVACFCAVYRNTQIIFLKDCGLSFLTEIIEPFILYSIPSVLRAISLKNGNFECMYKLSEMIPIF